MKEEKTNNYYAYIIDSNGLKKEFEVSESGILNIGNKNLKGILFSNATEVYCYNNQLSSLDLPNATSVSCKNNNLSSLVNNCGIHNRTIWSQKIKGKIYTYIGCGRFTLEEAKVAILKKYPRDKAETYIEKVKLSQSLVN